MYGLLVTIARGHLQDHSQLSGPQKLWVITEYGLSTMMGYDRVDCITNSSGPHFSYVEEASFNITTDSFSPHLFIQSIVSSHFQLHSAQHQLRFIKYLEEMDISVCKTRYMIKILCKCEDH